MSTYGYEEIGIKGTINCYIFESEVKFFDLKQIKKTQLPKMFQT